MSRRALVAVKRVIDYNARVRVKPDQVGGRSKVGTSWRGARTREQQGVPNTPTLPHRTAQSGVDLTNVKMSMNPFCEIALEVRRAPAGAARAANYAVLCAERGRRACRRAAAGACAHAAAADTRTGGAAVA